MSLELRKLVNFWKTTCIEGNKEAPNPRQMHTAAIVKNPWFGRGFVEDLKPEIHDIAPVLGKCLTDEPLAVTGGGDSGHPWRGGTCVGPDPNAAVRQFIPQYGRGRKLSELYQCPRANPGGAVVIPLMDEHDAGRRSYCRIGDRYQDLKYLGDNTTAVEA